MSNFRLPTKEEYEKLPASIKECLVTDFGVLMGCRFIYDEGGTVSFGDIEAKGRRGVYFFDDLNEKIGKIGYHSFGTSARNPVAQTGIGLRPVTDVPNDVEIKIDSKGNGYCYYGFFPSKIVDSSFNTMIENNGTTTENSITIFINNEPVTLNTIEYNGKYYVKMDNYTIYSSQGYTMVNGRVIDQKSTEPIYLEVEPIMWLTIDNNTKMISRDVLAAGISPYIKKDDNTYEYNLDKFFSEFEKDIFKIDASDKKETEIKSNVIHNYHGETSILSDMKLCLELDEVMYLHGLPASGKSDRIYELDPDATVVYLASQDPSTLFGTEMLDGNAKDDDGTIKTKLIFSYWVKDIINKANKRKENGDTRYSILFFDEFSNAHPAVQALILKLIDERAIDGIPLPDNVRIVLAGNEITDSSIAHTLVQPLLSRVSHIEIKTSLEDWLEWAYNKRINPYITAFIYQNEEYLRTQFDGKKPHCDPRRWSMASRVLYSTANVNSIEGLVSDEVLKKFVAFCKMSKDITVESFMNMNDIVDDENYRYSLLASLVDKVTDSDTLFRVLKKMDELGFSEEEKAYFKMSWIKGYEERQKIIDYYEMNIPLEYKSDKESFNLSFEKISNKDLLDGYIESNTSVFLHGKPGIGKTDRVKTIDPNCTVVSLSSLGKSGIVGTLYLDYDNNEILQSKPSWLRTLEEKCAAEPDKIHILFFDEFTNAHPVVQGLVMNIVLYHRVGIGGWPLPPNARVVAAGNEAIDSKAASNMAEPVYGRFSHIYYEVNVLEWLDWAVEHNIHPLVIDFIMNKELFSNNTNNNMSVLMPSIQDSEKMVTPRTWEVVSKNLYAMERLGSIDYTRLKKKLPDSMLNSFIDFAEHYDNYITVEGIISGKKYDLSNYTMQQLTMLVRSLVRVRVSNNPQDIDKVREFIRTNMGGEALEIFDTYLEEPEKDNEMQVKSK